MTKGGLNAIGNFGTEDCSRLPLKRAAPLGAEQRIAAWPAEASGIPIVAVVAARQAAEKSGDFPVRSIAKLITMRHMSATMRETLLEREILVF